MNADRVGPLVKAAVLSTVLLRITTTHVQFRLLTHPRISELDE